MRIHWTPTKVAIVTFICGGIYLFVGLAGAAYIIASN